NYFKGNDKSKWNCNIPTSMAVLYEKLYKNIDLKVYGIEKQIEYDWLVKTGGDPGDIKFKYENVKGTRIDKEGNLLIETGFGELMHKCPFSYQVIGGEQRVIDVEFKKIAEDTYGFAVGDYDPTIDLVIDPVVLAYSTYLGGGSSDYAEGIAIDADGNVYVAGTTDSTDFPTLNEYQTDPGDTARDVFVSKLDPTESGAAGLLYSTYIGGGDDDRGNAIAVDSGGNVYVAGTTNSINFPTVNEYQTDEGDSNSDAFVLKLDTSQSGASGLLYSTYLGGLQDEYGTGIAVDTGGNAYVTGNTNSLSFPFLNEYQGKAEDGSTDAFMAKLDPAQSGVNSLLYATCLGGDEDDSGRAIAVDSSGNAYVTGDTNSTDFPTRDEYQSDPGDTASDVFVTKLDPALDGDSSLLYSTYLGGGGGDYAEGIAVDAGGNAYVTGRTYSTNFPTLNEYQADEGDSASDAFVTKLDPSQSGTSGLLYSTYLGGGASDSGLSITVDSGGNTYVTGYTGSTNFPTLNEYQTDPGDAQYDVIVVMMDLTQSGTSSLIFSTYLGGTGNEEGNDIAVDGNGNVYVTGESASTDFPVLNQYQSDQTAYDAFITKLSFVPTVDTPTSAAVTYTTATLGGNVSNIGAGNVTERGIYWSTTDGFTPPSQGTKVSETGSWGTGVFTVNATGLPGGTTIYFQAFAANSAGSGYSSQSSFTTATLTIPVVTTTAISGVTSTTAAGGGNVTSNGGASVTARGVCWSTNANPTTTDSTTSDGTGTGAFTSGITGLSPGTTYYVRAYAVNSVGTSYGSELSFTAGTTAPTVTTTAASGITSTTASSGGNVTSDGGATVTARGVCWSTTANPTTTDSTTSDGTGTGTFTSALTGLLPNTSYYVRAYAVNSAGTSYGSDLTFATNSAGAAVITSVASSITSTTATSGGNVTSDGGAAVTARGVCWSTSANPTTADSTTSDGSGTGAFSSAITGLSADTTYHVRAYAVNSSGTVYGSDLTFTTGTAGLTVTTTAVSSITSTTASSGGNVTSNGGSEVTARGVCWSTSANPTTTDSTTSDGTGTGEFTSGITGLLANTTYYVRAYAVNSDGTSYGSDLTFSTGMAAPTVTTTAASSITSTTASSGGNVTSNGGSAVTARGVCWSTSANPTTADGTTSDGTGTGVFSSGITGLSAYTTYHVRAYAVNSVGTSYGSDLTFSTSTPPEILLNRTHLNYGSVPETDNSTLLTTSTQTILINNTGGGVLNWTATDDADWLILSPGSGTGKGAITVTIDPSGIQPGTYTVSITIEAPNAVNSPQTVPVTLTVYESGTTTIPFGYFETPIDGSTVTSSIPVTGWALDDIDITSVKIYRAPIPGHETGGLVYIGDAIMVDGARPDVEQQFPTYPKDYQAGWGYMMLT
ncbi:MAG: hypothetical protein GY765_00470, partial [bacterium]|nr:hypothetical protein [bacterium]